MKVTCKINNLNDVKEAPTLERLRKYYCMPDGEIDLVLKLEYQVYGIVFWDNCPWYYICTEDYDEYPIPFAADFFEVVDNHLSKLNDNLDDYRIGIINDV